MITGYPIGGKSMIGYPIGGYPAGVVPVAAAAPSVEPVLLNTADRTTPGTLSNGDLTWTNEEGSAVDCTIRATKGLFDHKFYWEFYADTIANNGASVGLLRVSDNINNRVGNEIGWGYHTNGQFASDIPETWGANTYSGTAAVTGDVIQVAYDALNGKVWIGVNNVWQWSGNPSAGTSPVVKHLGNGLFPALTCYGDTCSLTARFAASEFTYTPPTGFIAPNDDPGLLTRLAAETYTPVSITLDPANNNGLILTNGDLTAEKTDSGFDKRGIRATSALSDYKFYWEMVNDVVASNGNYAGLFRAGDSMVNRIGQDTAWGYRASGYFYEDGANVRYVGTAMVSGTITQIAYDAFEGRVWIGINGAWLFGGDPATGKNPNAAGIGSGRYPGFTGYAQTCKFTLRFKASEFSYSIPSGFVAPGN